MGSACGCSTPPELPGQVHLTSVFCGPAFSPWNAETRMSATSAPREEKVAERIKLTANDGTIEPLEEKAFGREDELQALIATHPELLDGEKMRQEELDRLLQTGGEAEQQPVDRRVERRRAEKVHLRRHSRPLDLEQQRPA